MIIIRLGDDIYDGKEDDEGYELLHFLNALMYPHKKDFMEVMKTYIDFSGNEELWKEVENMSGLGQSVLEEGIERGIERGLERGFEEGQNLLAELIEHLFEDNRIEDVELAAKDETARKQLYKEYGMIK